ncbi:MAG: ribokinase [Calditrichaeota bacterium]|nr:ribokinase [Calditrichota bacterium]
MKNKVAVVGSYNIDQTIHVPKIPVPGETVIGGGFVSGPGGKGANQAVAAARAGADVSFIAKVGADPATAQALRELQAEGLNIDYLIHDEAVSTGRAWIVVDTHGENSIVVAPGANARLSPADVAAAGPAIEAADVLLLQLETPLETVLAAADIAAGAGTTVILNPAPACALSPEILRHTDIITPNIVEAQMLSDVACSDEISITAAARALRGMGVKEVIITLGKKGAYVQHGDREFRVPAYPVQALDSTGAGDVFNGCLAAFLGRDRDIREAVAMACAAAAISVTKSGAQASIPYLAEIEAFYRQHGSEQ